MNLLARMASLFRRDYQAASGGPRWPNWVSMWAPARQQLMARHQLSAQSNYMIANSPSAASIADVWTASLVGDGPSVRFGDPDQATRGALEQAWGRFYGDCDQEGVANVGGLLSGLARSMIINGEGLFHFVTSRRGELRLRATRDGDKKFIQPGDTVTLTAPIGDVSSGLIVVGKLAGVCAYYAAAGEEVELAPIGVWELPKASGQINEGAAVWWSTTDQNAKNATGAGLYPIGMAVRGDGSSDTTVRVRLSGVPVAAVGG